MKFKKNNFDLFGVCVQIKKILNNITNKQLK